MGELADCLSLGALALMNAPATTLARVNTFQSEFRKYCFCLWGNAHGNFVERIQKLLQIEKRARQTNNDPTNNIIIDDDDDNGNKKKIHRFDEQQLRSQDRRSFAPIIEIDQSHLQVIV